MTFVVDLPPVVVDASVAIDFLGGDSRWRHSFDSWADEDRILLAPAHFFAEVANAQLRGQRVRAAHVAARVERMVASGIEAADRGIHGLLEAINLAERHGLTVYDALYLQLALDVDGELATLDKDQRRAAAAEDLIVIG